MALPRLTKPVLPAAAVPPVLAVLFAFVFNAPLLAKVWGILVALGPVKWGFVISIGFFLVAFFNFFFTILCSRYTTKPLMAVLIPLSAAIIYTMHTYGIVIDRDMIVNIVETNYGEAVTYVNPPAVLWMLGLGVLPAALLCMTRITYPSLRRGLVQKGLSVLASLLVIALIAAFYYKDYASVIRNNTHLRKMVVPSYALDAGLSHVRRKYFHKELPYQKIGLDAQQHDPDIGTTKDLVVVIVGETQRSMNYSLNGYGRETNPYTRNLGVMSFTNATSCGTATAVSVPCMFSQLGRKGYNKDLAMAQDNLLDISSHSDVHVLWLDNDSGCKDVCGKVAYIDLRAKYIGDPKYCNGESCRDEVFLDEFERQLTALPDQTALVVLHIMGSHGPTYYQRYSDAYKAFTPDCPRSDIQNCTHEQLVNTYDNTIVYSDHVMAGVIDILKRHEDKRTSALLFMSDHGESLGEKGVYLHGLPYAVAPDEQTHVPFITWFSDRFAADRGIDMGCVPGLLNKPYSHDNFFHTVLGLLDVTADVYKKDMDVFAACRTLPPLEEKHE